MSTPAPAGLRVIGAGFGRTGTASLKRALEQIGFAPCYHMEEVVHHPEDVPLWEAAARGEPVDWRALFDRWGAAVDFPAALYYRELMAAYPEARVILTLRDPESWYESMANTIHPMLTRFPNRVVGRFLPRISGPFRSMGATHLARDLIFRFGEKEHVLGMFRDWHDEVRRVVPPERLLEYRVSEGWGPLCAFLGVPVPDLPFPRVNDTRTFQRRTTAVTAMSWMVLLAPLWTAALAWWALR